MSDEFDYESEYYDQGGEAESFYFPPRSRKKKTMKKKYTIYSGRPSWHQAKAGHAWAASMTAEYTPEELATLKANLEKRGEPYYIEETKKGK